MDAWMWVGAAAVTAIVWFAGLRGKKSDSDIVLRSGDDAQKSARMAERAKEYEMKYGTREGNYTA